LSLSGTEKELAMGIIKRLESKGIDVDEMFIVEGIPPPQILECNSQADHVKK
jgi:hypothetical protein